MALVIVGLGGTQTINTSGSDSVTFLGLGTLNVTGTPASPIDVTLSSVGGVGLLDAINITNARVTLGGLAGVGALVGYSIGSGGTLNLASTLGVTLGTTITFTGLNSRLVLGSGIDVSLLGGIFGFGPGSTIDVTPLASSVTYADAAGNNTGGTITLRDAGGAAIGTLTLASGNFVASNFTITPDGTGGTLIGFATAFTSIVASPATADLGAGQVVTFTLTTSDPVTISGGAPSLALNDGGTATYVPASSTSTSLVFTYTVAPGENTPDLAVTSASANGATILNGANETVSLASAAGNPAGILHVDTTTPLLTALTASPGTAALGAGQVVTFTLTASEPVTVAGGVPTLTLNDGGTATYNAAASTPTSLVFTHTVAAGQNSADLAVTAANPNGATIADAAGNAASLAAAVANPAGILQIDTIAPTVTAIATQPGAGAIAAGGVVAIALAISEPVTVAGGTPTLTLNNGGTATFSPAASTPTSLVFNYTVGAGQNTADLTVTAANLNGAVIADPAANPVDLSGAIGNPPGVLTIDTVAPTILSIAASPATGNLGIGRTATITLTASEAVTVSGGTPTLTLNDGGTATYSAAGSTATSLAFTYTVAAGESTPDLAVTAASLNGAAINDLAGNAIGLAAAVANPAGILQVDGIVPVVTGVTTTPGSGAVGTGQAVTVTLAISEAVTVAGGSPTLTLSNGGTAIFSAAGSTPTSLAFVYTVAAGDTAADLAVSGVNLNGAVVADAAANPANLSGGVGNPPGVLTIDTTTPLLTALTASPGTAALGAGQVVTFTLTASEPVTVAGGVPTLTLNDGGTATYNAAASTPTSLVFTHTVAAGQNSADLAVTAANPNGATIADAAGNAASLAAAVANPAGILQIDTIAPTVTAIATQPGAGAIAAGGVVAIALAISEPVTVAGGTPTLTLNNGGTATFSPAASTPTSLVFNYTVGAGQNTADLTVTAANLNGAVIADPAANPVDLSGAIGNPPGVLTIDTVAPTVSGVTTQPGSGVLTTGNTALFTVATTEPVTVTGGVPTLTLNDGGVATYDPTRSTPTALVFTYTVAAGENTPDLTVTAVSLNGAVVTDAAMNAANLAGAVGNPAGILQVDTSYSPFTGLLAGAADPAAVITVSASVRPATTGTFSNLGGGTVGADGVTYSVTGTAAQVNAALAGVRLSPAMGSPTQTGVNGAIVNSAGVLTSLTSGSGADALTGDAANNVITGGAGADILAGGLGVDTLSYAGSAAGVFVSLGEGRGLGGDAAGDVFSGFENITGSQANDSLAGDGLANTLSGLGGDDVLIGGGGADVLDGGLGIDTLSYASSTAGVYVDLSQGVALNGDAQGDVISGFENVTGGSGSDTLVGDAGANRLDGGLGNDGLTGGAGADTLIGGDGFDLAYYASGSVAVVANLQTGVGTAGDAAGDTLQGIEGLVGTDFDDTLTGDGATNLIAGGIGNDTLYGGGGDDAVFGQQGNDTIFGGDGNDLLRGGEGADAIDGGTGFNLAIYDTASAGVQISLSTLYANTGEATGDTFFNIQGFLGSDYDDAIVGDDNSNLLLGGLGNDVLLGGVGYDSMDGGGGSDTFLFEQNFQFDTIVGFQTSGSERDVLSFSTAVFGTAQQALASVYTDPNGAAFVYAGGNNVVVLAGVTASQLTIDNFRVF